MFLGRTTVVSTLPQGDTESGDVVLWNTEPLGHTCRCHPGGIFQASAYL